MKVSYGPRISPFFVDFLILITFLVLRHNAVPYMTSKISSEQGQPLHSSLARGKMINITFCSAA
jgi:hypothetical protein